MKGGGGDHDFIVGLASREAVMKQAASDDLCVSYTV